MPLLFLSYLYACFEQAYRKEKKIQQWHMGRHIRVQWKAYEIKRLSDWAVVGTSVTSTCMSSETREWPEKADAKVVTNVGTPQRTLTHL